MVLVYSDNKKLVFEMLSTAVELGKNTKKKVIAVIIGKPDESLAKEYISYGADEVFIAETNFESFKAEEYSDILSKVIMEKGTDTILIGSNKNGKELASRLAGKMDIGCIIDCTDIYIKDNKLTGERTVYSGNAISVEQLNFTPGILTVSAKVFDPLKKDGNKTGDIFKKKYDINKTSSKMKY